MARKRRKPDKSKSKTAGKTANPQNGNGNGHAPMPVLIPQPNGSALLAGGVPGNAGGTGRPRSAIRDRAAQLYDEKGMAFLESVIGGDKIDVDVTDMFGKIHEVKRRATIRERTEASKLLGTVGLGEMKELTVDDVRQRLQRTLTILRKRLAPEELVAAVQEGRAPLFLDSVLNDLRPVWAG